RRAGEPCGGDDLQPDAAAADDADAVSACDTRDVADRAEAGDDAAAEQRGLPERQLARDLDGARRCDDGALGEARRQQAVLERLAVHVQATRAVEQRPGDAAPSGRLAEAPTARPAGAAAAARR